MLKSVSNKLASAFGKSKTIQLNSPSENVKWPNDVTISGEPLFSTYLTDADLDSLQESAGLGSHSWWLHPDFAKEFPEASSPTFEEEVSLTAWLRAPFEQAGPLRDSSYGLLDRLNELNRLHILAAEENERKFLGMDKRVRHHSTLLLTDSTQNLHQKQTEEDMRSPTRRDTYALPKVNLLTSTPAGNQPQQYLSHPRFCKSPERSGHTKLETTLHRTYSKHSLDRLQVDGELQRNSNFPASEISENSTNLLGRTYDAEELSDVFSSPRASTEHFQPSHPPPPTPSSELPQTVSLRKFTHDNRSFPKPIQSSPNNSAVALALQQEACLRASVSKRSGGFGSSLNRSGGSPDSGQFTRKDNLVPRSSASPVRSGHILGRPSSSSAKVTALRDSLPTRLEVNPPSGHKLSAPIILDTKTINTSQSSLKKSGSGSNIIPLNLNETIQLALQQEMDLRASSGRSRDVSASLTSSLEAGSKECVNKLNSSLPLVDDGGGLTRLFAQREVKDIPSRYVHERNRSTGGGLAASSSASELKRQKSGSQSSLKNMDSVVELMRDQKELLRASHEQIIQKALSKNSLSRSVESRFAHGSESVSGDGSPQPPIKPSENEPEQHQENKAKTELRDSGATYELSCTGEPGRASVSSRKSLNLVEPPRPSTSPVRMRRQTRNIPPPLTLPIDIESVSPSSKGNTPSTAKTVRPGSYVDQLQCATHASSAVEAWVADTIATKPENEDPNLAMSCDSTTETTATDADMRGSSDTYVLPSKPSFSEANKISTSNRPSGLPRPAIVRGSIPRLLKPPVNPKSTSSKENVMTTSQRIITRGGSLQTARLRPTGFTTRNGAGVVRPIAADKRVTALRPAPVSHLPTHTPAIHPHPSQMPSGSIRPNLLPVTKAKPLIHKISSKKPPPDY